MKNIVISYLGYFFLKLWSIAGRNKDIVASGFQELLQQKGQFILCGWHNNSITFAPNLERFIFKKHHYQPVAMVSKSKDGDIASLLLHRFHIQTVRGSSSKGGKEAFMQLLREAKNGKIPVITPDGPLGPAFQVKPGVIRAAIATGLPIVTYCTMPEKYKLFAKSWDQHRFPAFASRVFIHYSDPLIIPKLRSEEDIKIQCQALEQHMMQQEKDLAKLVHNIAVNQRR